MNLAISRAHQHATNLPRGERAGAVAESLVPLPAHHETSPEGLLQQIAMTVATCGPTKHS